jgi:hypothetical protein
MRQIRLQSYRLFQGGSGRAPILFRREHQAKLEMRVPIIRLERDGGATFINGGIQIADTKEGLGQFQPVIRVVRYKTDCTTQPLERCHHVGSLVEPMFGD